LLITAIAIGYDQQCFIDWKNNRSNFDSFEKIYKRADRSENVPPPEKSVLPILKRYWNESSQVYSHYLTPKSIRTLIKDGQVHLEPKTATYEFQEGRMNTIRNMLLNVVSVLLGIIQFHLVAFQKRDQFPEGKEIVERANNFFQNKIWLSERTY